MTILTHKAYHDIDKYANMKIQRRKFLGASGVFFSSALVGCLGFNDSSEIPVSIQNTDSLRHTVALIVTDEEGNTDFFDGTISVQRGETASFGEGITVPDATPRDVVARVLVDDGSVGEVAVTLDFDAEVSVVVGEDGVIGSE